MARPFIGDRRGAVFVLFSLVMPVILAGVLGLMSLSGLSTGRADLQAASSAAANAVLADLNSALQISGTPDAIVPDVDKQMRASAVVQSLLGGRSDFSNIATSVVTTPTTISVTVSAQIRNMAGDLFSLPFFGNSATTTVSWLRTDQMQVIFSIDAGTTAGKTSAVASRIALLKPMLLGAVDILSALPNYPNVGVSIVPFTAQVSADPTLSVADASSEHDPFWDAVQSRFADATEHMSTWMIPQAHAGVTQCFGDPLVPRGVDGSSFMGTSSPLSQPCETSLPRIRPLAGISRPFVKGVPSGTEPLNAPAKLARDDIKSALNSITPSGCRNLAMGVTWSMAQLPIDNNPKIIFLISNGSNSQSKRGRTSECNSTSAKQLVSSAQLDQDFTAACALVRDPEKNKGRVLDLYVLQFGEGNSVALNMCASTSDRVGNYFSASPTSLAPFFRSLAERFGQIARVQFKTRSDFIAKKISAKSANESGENENKKEKN